MTILLLAYVGPWIPLPFLSLLVGAIGLFLAAGRSIYRFGGKCLRVVLRK